MNDGRLVVALLVCAFAAGGCSSPRTWTYERRPGYTATLSGGRAVPPEKAPVEVARAIHAANRIVGKPWVHGGGHARVEDQGYDCSGTVSYALIHAGLLRSPLPSSAFRRYGKSGEGDWITVYAWDGHVFADIAGLRLDTGYRPGDRGPSWTTKSRPIPRRSEVRHPAGF